MAKDPNERYPSAGDLGQAALVAAGGLRRAGPWSIVATGEAAPIPHAAPPVSPGQAAKPLAAAPEAPAGEGARGGRAEVLRWAVALASLAIVAVGMVVALRGISSL